MKTVYKYPIPIVDEFELALPDDAECLTVQLQGITPCLWVLLDPSAPTSPRHFRLAGTGYDLGEGVADYVGSFQTAGGALVFHLFEADS